MKFKLSKAAKHQLRIASVHLELGDTPKGFRRFRSTVRPRLDAFYHRGLGLVVKKPKFIMDPRTPTKLRVPTIALGMGWVVQPLTHKILLKLAMFHLSPELAKCHARGIRPDAHTGNVGWYNGKAVLFDW